MPNIKNSTLKAEIARIAKAVDWEKDNWNASRMAAAVVRTVLTEMGCLEELKDEFKQERQDLVESIRQCFTAPINYQRDYMVTEKLAPEKAKQPKQNDTVLELA